MLTELRTSKAQLETETAKQLQLTQQRDLNWETYKTLSSKVAELNLTRAAASSEVRFGAPAVAAIDAVEEISLVLGVAASGIVGLDTGRVLCFPEQLPGQVAVFLLAARSKQHSYLQRVSARIFVLTSYSTLLHHETCKYSKQ